MVRPKLIRITTIPLSLEKLLEGQLHFMKKHFNVIAVSSQKERLERYGKNEGVSTFYLPLTRKITPIKDIIAVYKLFRFLVKEKPQIVHTHTPKAGLVGMFASFFARVPIRLHTVAGLPLMEKKGFIRLILNLVESFTYRCATKVYPNSHKLYDFILSENFTKPIKLKVLGQGSSNGIDTSYFDRNIFSENELILKKRKLQIEDDDITFIFIGRIVKDKGINELIAAFSIINRLRPNTKLLLVGSYEEDLDPLLNQTKEQINNNPNIITTGYQEDVRVFYSISDILVFPSYREGFPNVVLQAGAMYLPSIVSNINGCNEIITHNKNGLIVSVKNIEELKNAMVSLLKDKTLRNNLKKQSRKIIIMKYEQKSMWNTILEEYRQELSTI